MLWSQTVYKPNSGKNQKGKANKTLFGKLLNQTVLEKQFGTIFYQNLITGKGLKTQKVTLISKIFKFGPGLWEF